MRPNCRDWKPITDVTANASTTKRQAASSPDNKSTHTTSIALLIGPVALITLATTMEPAGILIAAPLTIATFLSEVHIKQLILRRDSQRQENYFNTERRRIQAELDITKKAA